MLKMLNSSTHSFEIMLDKPYIALNRFAGNPRMLTYLNRS